MSFLLDPPLLVASGAAIDRVAPDDRTAALMEGALVAGFVGVSVGLYMNLPATRWLWELCRAESGRDWMLNSGVFDVEYDDPPVRTHLISGAIFATYPLWAHLGRKLGRRLRRRRRPSHLTVVSGAGRPSVEDG